MTITPQLLTIPQAAAYIGMHKTTVYKLVSEGRLEAVDVSPPGAAHTRLRIPTKAADAFIDTLPRIVETPGSRRNTSGKAKASRP
jgi:excisionase family DNA binding protein